jgi:hypothetical protein
LEKISDTGYVPQFKLSPSEAKNKSVGSLAESEELIPQQYVA